jgi:transcriptional regulator with XRE-family HTH domain
MTKTRGHRELKKWLQATKTTQVALARAVKRSEPAVSLWLNRGSRPDGDARIAINKLTGIPPEAWIAS